MMVKHAEHHLINAIVAAIAARASQVFILRNVASDGLIMGLQITSRKKRNQTLGVGGCQQIILIIQA